MPEFSSHTSRILLILLPLLTPWSAQGLSAQQAQWVVRAEENFRAQPNGPVLGRLNPGARVVEGAREGQWSEVTVEGWVWLASLQERTGTLNLVVAASGGENFRSQPQGTVLGRLAQGTLLQELERRPGWVRVRRTGWMWRPSLEAVAASAAVAGAAARAPAPASAAAPAAVPPVGGGEAWIRSGSRGLPVLSGPGGDTLAVTGPGTEMQLLGRQGNWSRVRLEGWVWTPEGQAAGVADVDGGAAPVVSASEILEAPDSFLGRVVTLTLQFISLERAERVRTDFYEGEPFMLTRAAEGGGGFVYVALPPERVGEVQGIAPLDRIQVTGRVRAGAGTLTGSPILDLQQVRRLPPGSGR